MKTRTPPWIRVRNRRRLLGVIGALAAVTVVVFAIPLHYQDLAPTPHPNVVSTTAISSTAVQSSIQDARISDMPDMALTPGAVTTTDTAAVCEPGYATRVRPNGAAWKRLKEQAYDEYGIPRGHRSTVDPHGVRHPAYEVDHLVPLEIGGAPTDIRNIWPEPIDSALKKDKVENELHELVCSARMPIAEAQAAIARNWKTALPQ